MLRAPVEPAGLQFQKPILVSVPNEGNVTKENIMIARYSDGGVIDTILPYSVDEENKIVQFTTNHFTSFALQEGWNLIVDDIDEQTVIQSILTATGIDESKYTNDEWDKILNTVLVEEGNYRVYDMFLEYDNQKRMSDEIVAGNYAQAIKIIFPESKSALEKQIETMKSLKETLNFINQIIRFDPRKIVAGGADMVSQIISAVGRQKGLPTSISAIARVNRYVPKPLDFIIDNFRDIDNVFYRTFWEELRDILTYGGDEDDVMDYDVQNSSTLSAFMQDGSEGGLKLKALLTEDMIHNLKLIFLKNIHFIEHKDTYLDNLITTIHYYYEADEKFVRVLPENHQTFFVSGVHNNYGHEFKAYATGYSQDSFLDKNAHVTLYYEGIELKKLYFDDKNEDGSYSAEGHFNSFLEAGNYVLDWKYKDSEGVEKEGKYYVKFIEPYHATIADYRIISNYIDNDEGFIEIAPIFDTNGYVRYTTEIQLGEIILTEKYKGGIKIPNYADIVSGKLGEVKLNELKNAQIKFTAQKSSTYVFDTKEFTVDLFEYALNGSGGVFDSLNIYLDGQRFDTVVPAKVAVLVDISDPFNLVPTGIDYDNDGIYDKVLELSDTSFGKVLDTYALYSTKGVYKPCVNFLHVPTKLEKRICYDYDITITGEDEPVVVPVEIPELIASRTEISVGWVVTFTLDLINIGNNILEVGVGGEGANIIEEDIATSGEYFIKVRYTKEGIFFPYVEVALDDGSVLLIESQIIKVGTSEVGTITHNNTTYGTVTSPYTGKVWLDRNLGASQVCTAFNNTACYGDYYQWGRNFDGHQSSSSATSSTQATDVNSAGSSFIKGSSDWTSTDGDGSQRSANWSKADGSSVCPIGFTVPSFTELREETLDNGVTNSATAFSNFLKLPSAGGRDYSYGSMFHVDSWGYVWSSSVNGSYSRYIYFGSSGASSSGSSRANGFSVRCLRD